MSSSDRLSLLALAAAGFYALTGAIGLAHEQPSEFADAIDYWIEAFFVAALAASVATLVILGRSGRSGAWATLGCLVAASGNAALLVAAAATMVSGRESLDPLFALGFLAIVAGYLALAVAELRGRLHPKSSGFVFLASFAATVLADNVAPGSGGLVLGAGWVALSRLLAAPGEPAGSPASPATG